MQKFDAIILGNGLIAKTMALALEALGLAPIRVAKPFPAYQNDPRSYAIAPSSLRMLKALGLEFDATERTDVGAVDIGFGAALRDELIRFDAAHLAFAMIDHSVLDAKLDAALNSPLLDAAPREFEVGEFFVDLPAEEIKAPLLLIAEGKTGEALSRLGFSFSRHDFGQKAITAKFNCERPHEGVARQLFEPSGPLGILPFAKKGISIVWSQDAPLADALMDADDAVFLAALQDRLGGHYGALEWAHPRAAFPLQNAVATRLTQPRIALLGDSAHLVHPMAGQGLNLGLRDVAVMTETVRSQMRVGLDIGASDALENYALARKGDIARLQTLTRSLSLMMGAGGGGTIAIARSMEPLLKDAPIFGRIFELADAPLSPLPPLLAGRLY